MMWPARSLLGVREVARAWTALQGWDVSLVRSTRRGGGAGGRTTNTLSSYQTRVEVAASARWVFKAMSIIMNSSSPLNQVSLQSKSSTLSSTTSETSSSERRSSSTRARSSNMMATGSAVSSPALSSASVSTGSSPVLRVNIFEHCRCSSSHNSLRSVHSTHLLPFFCLMHYLAIQYYIYA